MIFPLRYQLTKVHSHLFVIICFLDHDQPICELYEKMFTFRYLLMKLYVYKILVLNNIYKSCASL